MAEIINLRQARKRRARLEKAAAADANRVRHGRTKAERRAARDEEFRRNSVLDGARLGTDADQGPVTDDDTPLETD